MAEIIEGNTQTESQDQASQSASHNSSQSSEVDLSKYLPKEEATRIIGDQRKDAFEKGYSLGVNEAKQDRQPEQKKQVQSKNVDIDEVVNKRIDEFKKQLEQKAQAEVQQKQQELQTQQVAKMVNELVPKIKDAEQQYSDFNEVTSNIQFEQYPEVLSASNDFDNAGHILYELAKNPSRLAVIDNLMSKGNRRAALTEMRKLSGSIKDNQSVSHKKTPAPLNSVKSSNVGDNGQPLSISDLKKKYRA